MTRPLPRLALRHYPQFPWPPPENDPRPSSHHADALAQAAARTQHSLPSSSPVLSCYSQKAHRCGPHSDLPKNP